LKGLNRVQLIGNVSRQPEVKYIPNGTAVAKFGLATTERFKNKQGEWTEKAEFHNLLAWSKLAETIGEYVSKGSRLFVEGKLQTTSYEKDGQKKYFTEVVVENMVMMDNKGGAAQNVSTSVQTPEPAMAGADDSDTPF
jgi:single-strand DNA-binding protein